MSDTKHDDSRDEAPTSVEGDPAPVDPGGKKGKYRKPKPWDTDDIDHWKVEPWEDIPGQSAFTEESSFATLFPAYREKYLREVWPEITRELKSVGIACELNLVEGSMTVKTTLKTRDPYAILNARDLIKLLSRSVPAAQALKILRDDVACDVIKIGGMVRNKERFVKRRARLLGPNGATLKAMELLTETYILVQGNTVAVMGPYKGLKQVRRIVESCMKNVHPIYSIKELMIKRELAKDPELVGQSWDRFLPQFKKTNPKKKKLPANDDKNNTNDNNDNGDGQEKNKRGKNKKKKKGVIEKKEYNPFPPAQMPSKVDLEIESGAYFMKADEREAKRREERAEKNREGKEKRKREREKSFVAPAEPITPSSKALRKNINNNNANNNNTGNNSSNEPESARKAKKRRKLEESFDASQESLAILKARAIERKNQREAGKGNSAATLASSASSSSSANATEFFSFDAAGSSDKKKKKKSKK